MEVAMLKTDSIESMNFNWGFWLNPVRVYKAFRVFAPIAIPCVKLHMIWGMSNLNSLQDFERELEDHYPLEYSEHQRRMVECYGVNPPFKEIA
jgi:hypothetical protein